MLRVRSGLWPRLATTSSSSLSRTAALTASTSRRKVSRSAGASASTRSSKSALSLSSVQYSKPICSLPACMRNHQRSTGGAVHVVVMLPDANGGLRRAQPLGGQGGTGRGLYADPTWAASLRHHALSDTGGPARWTALVACAVVLLAVAGCGYHTSGHAVRLPNNIHTIYVPMFDNATQTFRVEQTLTAAVIQELRSRTSYRIVSTNDGTADATLKGTVTNTTNYPLTYDSVTGRISSSVVA